MRPISREVQEQLPEQCRKCPVVQRFDILALEAAEYSCREIKLALGHLDEAVSGPDTDWPKFDRQEQAPCQATVSRAAFRRRAEERLAKVLELVDGQCPGSTRGGSRKGLAGALEFLAGARSCHNPNFARLQGDEEMAPRLREANWTT